MENVDIQLINKFTTQCDSQKREIEGLNKMIDYYEEQLDRSSHHKLFLQRFIESKGLEWFRQEFVPWSQEQYREAKLSGNENVIDAYEYWMTRMPWVFPPK